MPLEFQWDEAKARSNLEAHGVDFEEALGVFEDPLSLTIDDPDHSVSEQRFITMGVDRNGRHLVIVRTDRSDQIRLISARKATPSERRQYERGREVREMRAEYDFSGGVRGKYVGVRFGELHPTPDRGYYLDMPLESKVIFSFKDSALTVMVVDAEGNEIAEYAVDPATRKMTAL